MPFSVSLPIASKRGQGFSDSTLSVFSVVDTAIEFDFEDSTVSGSSFEVVDIPSAFECSTVSASSFFEGEISNIFEDSTISASSFSELTALVVADSTASGSAFTESDVPFSFGDATVSGSAFTDVQSALFFADSTVSGSSFTTEDIPTESQEYANYKSRVLAAGDNVRVGREPDVEALITALEPWIPNIVMLLTFTDRRNGLNMDSNAPTFIPIFNRNNRTITAVNMVKANRVQAGIEFTGTEHILLGVPLSDTPFTNFTYHLQATQTAAVQPSSVRWMLSNHASSNATLEIRRNGFSSTTGQFSTAAGTTSDLFTSGTGTNPGTGVSVGYTLTSHTGGTFNQSRLYTNATLRHTSAMTNNNATTGWAGATSTVRAILGCRRFDDTEAALHALFTAQLLLIMDIKVSASEVSEIQTAINTFVAATAT